MVRARWAVVILMASCVAATAAKRPPKPKPKTGRWLDQKQGLWYLLNVPKPFDANQQYPLLVATSHRDDRAHEAYNQWLKDAKLDQWFLATLNFPPGTKADREASVWKMVEEVCKKYENIDRRGLLLVGCDAGATAALKFLATYPRVFATAIVLNPASYPDVRKIRPTGPRLTRTNSRIVITFDPKNKQLLPKFKDWYNEFRRRGFRHIMRKPAIREGSGIASEIEHKLAIKVIRSGYSDEKRQQLAAVWQKEAEKIRKKKEADAKKIAAARAELEGKPRPGTQQQQKKAEANDPDSLWLKANALQNDKKDYAAAIAVYEKLLEIAPKSEYAPVAKQRIKELEADPQVRQTMADKGAGAECKRWLSLAGNYMRAGMNDKAAILLNKVISKHPQSSFAVQAREKLKQLGGSE